MPSRSLSIIALLFLAWHANACEVASYDELRNKSGRPGEQCELTAERTSGTFVLAPADPYGSGDDNGTVINANPAKGSNSRAWWVRKFGYAEGSPILLDWFQLQSGDDITELMARLARRHSPSLFVKMPSQPMSLMLGFVNLRDLGIKDLVIAESPAPVTLSSPSSTKDNMLYVGNFQNVRIGGPLRAITFAGTHNGPRDSMRLLRGTDAQRTNSVIGIVRGGSGDSRVESHMTFQANCKNTLAACVHLATTDMRNKTGRVIIEGNFTNSGIQVNGADTVVTDAYISDPYQEGLGWDGAVLADGRGRNGYYTEDISDGSKLREKFYTSKTKRAVFVHVSKLLGRIELEFGATWFMSAIGQIGVDRETPFSIEYGNAGFTSSGIKMDTSGFQAMGGKIDHLGPNSNDLPRYLKIAEKGSRYGFGLPRSVVLEATSEDGNGGQTYFTTGVNLVVENLSGSIITSQTNYEGDYSRDHRVSGHARPGQTTYVHDGDGVIDFIGYDIHVMYNSELRSSDESLKFARNCSISDSRIMNGGRITIGKGSIDTKMKNVVFEGSPRNVIHIRAGPGPDRPTELDIRNITAPTGSTITADDATRVRFSMNGIRYSLDKPFTFGISDIDQDSAPGD